MDLEGLSTAELEQLARAKATGDLNSLSTAQLEALAGVSTKAPEKRPEFFSLQYGGKNPTLTDAIMSGATGVLKGIGSGVSMPLDLGSWLGNKALGAAGYEEQIPYASDGVRAAVDALSDDYTPVGTLGRTVSTAGEFGGGTVGGGVLGKALAAAKGAPAAVQRVGDWMSSGMRQQMAGTGAAAGAAAIANETTEEGSAARSIAPILGALGYGAVAGGLKGVHSLGKSSLEESAEIAGRLGAQRAVKDVIDPDLLAARIQEAKGALRADPYGAYKTSAELIKDPGLAGLEVNVRTQSPILKASVKAREIARDSARVKSLMGATEESVEGGVRNLRQSLVPAYQAAKDKVTTLSNIAFKNAGEVPISRIKGALTSTVNKFTASGARELPAELNKLVENFKALPASVPLKTLHDYNSALGEWSKAAINASPIERMAASVAAKARSAIEDSLDKAMAKGTVTKRQVTAYKAMKKARLKQGELFERGAVSDIIETNPFNRNKFETSAAKVPSIITRTLEETADLINALKGQGQGRKAISQTLVANLTENTIEDGVINRAKYLTALRKIAKVDPTLINAKERKILAQIAEDFSSKKAFNELLKGGTVGSPTADKMTGYQALGLALTGQLTPILNRSPALRGIKEFASRNFGIGDAAKAKQIEFLTKAMLNVDDLDALMKPMAEQPGIVAQSFKSVYGAMVGENAASESTSNREAVSQSRQLLPRQSESRIEKSTSSNTTIPLTPNQVKSYISQQPPLIQAIAKVESGFDPKARGAAGEFGLMQLMPANVKKFNVSDPFNPQQNIAAGTKLLREEIQRFRDPRLALAAYNAGSPAVQSAIKRAEKAHGSKEWRYVAMYLPKTTQQYVPKVLREFNQIQKGS